MKERNGRKNVVAEYIKHLGMGNILAKCGNNLRAIKNHLFRECNLVKGTNLYHTMKKFKQYLENRLWEAYGKNVVLVEDFLRKNFGGEKNVG